jgi:hypothetical protein
MQCPWSICHIQRHAIRIGCEFHTTEEWESFTDERINTMDTKALKWWKIWKLTVMTAAHACKPYERRKQ